MNTYWKKYEMNIKQKQIDNKYSNVMMNTKETTLETCKLKIKLIRKWE